MEKQSLYHIDILLFMSVCVVCFGNESIIQ